jgi:hypothetical protein
MDALKTVSSADASDMICKVASSIADDLQQEKRYVFEAIKRWVVG